MPTPVTCQDLLVRPAPRWTAARKEDLVRKIARGTIPREQAMQRYDLSADELASMERRLIAYGRAGLKARRIQELR